MKFYFTYGTSGHPFVGGWTEVEAPDMDSACAVFSAFHPNRNGLLNCGSVYFENNFRNTSMAERGNFGAFCHEKITITRDVID